MQARGVKWGYSILLRLSVCLHTAPSDYISARYQNYSFSALTLLVWGQDPHLSVWPHLFRGAGHEKRRGEQLKWSLAFTNDHATFVVNKRYYLRCTLEVFHVHVQLPGPVHTARLGRVFFCIFSLGLCFACSFVLFDLFVSFLCFHGQLSHLPYSFCR